MKLLLEYLPIAIFFIIFKWPEKFLDLVQPVLPGAQFDYLSSLEPLILATFVLIPATLVQILVAKLVWKKVEKIHLITLVIVSIMGGLTIIFQDKNFIFWKPTVIDWLFAAGFIGYRLFTGKHLLQSLMASANLEAPEFVWVRLTTAWVLFFVVGGILNLYVAYNFSEDFWVDFKLFGMMAITIVFIIGQGIYMARYVKQDDTKPEESE